MTVCRHHRANKRAVSMKSGLEGRNNLTGVLDDALTPDVSMKSGLEGRNNPSPRGRARRGPVGLNEVWSRRPEQ